MPVGIGERFAPLAIYHCSLRVFTRSKGHSAVAAAAYRSGCQLYDKRIRKVHRYDKRSGVAETFILLPRETPSEFYQENSRQSGLPDRAFLWNAVEEAEKRKNSCVARELILALPHELSDKERRDLTQDMALYLMERYRVAVDAAIHASVEGDGYDERNHHAHILFSTRELTSQGFGKKTRILDDKVTGKAETELIREVWETLANDALDRAGFSDVRIDRRSLEEQGIDRIPGTHMGNSAKHAENQKGSSSRGDEDDKDDEEEGEGDKSSSSGSAGGGGGSLPPSLDLEPSELKEKAVKDEARSKYDRGSRADFIEEIKRLNEQRAVYSEIPLKDQIAYIDRLMDKLDVRVQHLERLKEGVSLSGKLKRSIEKLMEISVAAILNRKESRAAIKLTESEKQARAERQKTRYGRTYRAGLHEQIREMKQNLEILKTKSQEYTRYKGFVEKIEKELDKHSLREEHSLETSQVKSRFTTNQESSLNLALKASIARDQIPAEYRPKEGFRLTSLKPILPKSPKDIRNDKIIISNNTHSVETKNTIESNKISGVSESKTSIKAGVEAKAVSEKSRGVFNTRGALDPKVMSDPNPSYRQTIRNFDPLKSQQEKPENKSWLTRGSDKTKPMTDMINSKVAEMRKEQPQVPKLLHDLGRLNGAFNFNAENTKRTTYEAHREKNRAEAEMKRAQMPPEYRAKPYDSEPQAPSGIKGVQDALKSKWEGFRAGTQNPPEPKKTRVKMSNTFNRESFEETEAENHSDMKISTEYDGLKRDS